MFVHWIGGCNSLSLMFSGGHHGVIGTGPGPQRFLQILVYSFVTFDKSFSLLGLRFLVPLVGEPDIKQMDSVKKLYNKGT